MSESRPEETDEGATAAQPLVWALSLGAFALLVAYVATAHGHLDFADHALGRDFVNVWSAGHLWAEGRTVEIFSPDSFLAGEHRLFDPRLPFHFWSYPPTTLFMTAPLAALPYIPGLIAWTLAGFAALTPAVFGFLKPTTERALVLLGPAVMVNIALGQNGAFTCALLLGGLTLMERRPALAGALFGLLAVKPQIGLLLPIVVIAEERWRTLATAAATAIGLVAVSAAVFGVEAWRAFFAHTVPAQALMLSHGRGPFQWMMPSAYMSGRILGLPSGGAMALQLPFTLAAAWLTWSAWRGPGDRLGKGAVLLVATFAASPQAFNYDLIPVAVAAAVLLRRERGWADVALALMLLALPVVMMPLNAWRLPVAPVVLLGATWRLAVLLQRPPFPVTPPSGVSTPDSPPGLIRDPGPRSRRPP